MVMIMKCIACAPFAITFQSSLSGPMRWLVGPRFDASNIDRQRLRARHPKKGGPAMSKEPSLRHEYHRKKDRLDITIKHYALKKKSDRKDLIRHLLARLEKGPALARANAKRANGHKLPKAPMKETKLVQVGD
jgi:hypothetical protein